MSLKYGNCDQNMIIFLIEYLITSLDMYVLQWRPIGWNELFDWSHIPGCLAIKLTRK